MVKFSDIPKAEPGFPQDEGCSVDHSKYAGKCPGCHTALPGITAEQQIVRNMGRILRADYARGGDMSHVLLNLGRGCECDRCLAAKSLAPK